MYSFSILISLAAVEWHRLVTQNAWCKLEGIRHKLRTGLLEASDFSTLKPH